MAYHYPMPKTLAVAAPWIAKTNGSESRLVREALSQTFKGNTFLQAAAGLFAPHPGDITNTNIAFALEPGNSYTRAGDPNNEVEVAGGSDVQIEITITGTPTSAQLQTGTGYGISITSTIYHLDLAKTSNPVCRIERMASGSEVGDTNPRVIATLL
jgi:hypothetical protein